MIASINSIKEPTLTIRVASTTITALLCKRWYQKFRQGDFSLEDEPRAESSQKIETDELQALRNINSAQIEKELAEQLGVTQQAISVRLYTMRKVQKEGRWVPRELSKDNKNGQRNPVLTLLSKFHKKRFSAQNHYRR